MNKRRLIPGERHHWWPKSVSKFWTNKKGLIGCVHSSGKMHRATPQSTSRITDGHNIRIGSQWDETFENDFDRADENFPHVITFLENLVERHHSKALTNQPGLCAHSCKEADLCMLCCCLISLAVRSPKFRNSIVYFLKSLRKNIDKKEYKPLIALNMRDTYRRMVQNKSSDGKFMVVFSNSMEFIFGDGFYNNLSIYSENLQNVTILVPITPLISVLYTSPLQYMVEPRLVTLEADEDLVGLLNDTVQVYSKNWIFYKTTKPVPSENFLRGEHLIYERADPIDELLKQLPGILPPKDIF